MKKLIGYILAASVAVSVFPKASFAETEPIAIDNISVKDDTGTVNITGSVLAGAGERDVTIRVVEHGADLSEILENSDILQHIAQIKTYPSGSFRYAFDLNFERISSTYGSFDVYATYGATGHTDIETFTYYGSSENNVMTQSLVFNYGNMNVFSFGEPTIGENVSYKTGVDAYVDAEFAVKAFGGSLNKNTVTVGELNYTLNNTVNQNGVLYVNVKEFENIGKYVQVGDDICIISNNELDINADELIENFGVYVSKDGSDSNDGSVNSPVATIDKALELADDMKGFYGCHIYIMGGVYNLTDTVNIKGKSDICIENYANQSVKLSGSISLDGSEFVKVTDETILNRVGEDARGNLYELDLSGYINAVGAASLNNLDKYYKLYANDEKQILAKYPNAEYARPSSDGENTTFAGNDRIGTWDITDAYIKGVKGHYYYSTYRITSVDRETNTFTIDKVTGAWRLSVVYNILEELDMASEWFIDAKANKLYYFPTGNLSGLELTVFDKTVFNINNSKNITIKNITVEKINSDAIIVENSDNVIIDGIKINAVGGNGVNFKNSFNSSVRNSEIFDIARCPVIVDCGEIVTLKKGNSGAHNCHIYNFSDENANMSGVYLRGMGNYARNNVIHDSMSQGIMIEGNGHAAEYNEVYNVVRDISDGGAIYAGAHSPENIGTRIIGNYIHDINKSYDNWGDLSAIYLDNGFSGTYTAKNIIANSLDAGHFGGGRNNTVTNNIFIDGIITNYDERGALGGWLRPGYTHWSLDKITGDEKYTEEVEKLWYDTYPMWKQYVEDSAKEKAYLDTIEWDEEGNIVSSDESIRFDARLPLNVTITNNLVISDKKSRGIYPAGCWWNTFDPTYNTVYTGNLGVMASVNQSATINNDVNHDTEGTGSLRYEIIRNGNASIKATIGSKVPMGEIYKISAWIYAEKIDSEASAEIVVDKNPANTYKIPYPFLITERGEVNLVEGEWKEVYCYWVANDNNNGIVINFPSFNVGDIFYIDDVSVEKVMYSDVGKSGIKSIDTWKAGEYKYAPIGLDMSETDKLISVGDNIKIAANEIDVEQKDVDSDGKISDEEVKFVPTSATIVECNSSDLNVVTVTNDGTITGVGTGMAVITVRSQNGREAAFQIAVVDDGCSGKFLTDLEGYVKDYDPIYKGETIRPYKVNEDVLDVTAKPGTILSYDYYDTGIYSDLGHATYYFGYNIGDIETFTAMHDAWWTGKVKLGDAGRTISDRHGGWNQMTVTMYDAGEGKVGLKYYHNGDDVTGSTPILVDYDESVVLYAEALQLILPQYIKNIFVIEPGEGEIVNNITDSKIIFDNFDSDVSQWLSTDTDKLNSVKEGNTGVIRDDFKTWFADFDNNDFTQNEDSELFDLIPGFESIEFNEIGNTALLEKSIAAPALLYPPQEKKVDRDIAFVWNEVSGASEYYIVISKNSDLSEPVYHTTVNTNTIEVELLESGKYYWSVTAKNLSKQYACAAISDIGEFYITNGLTLSSINVGEAVDGIKNAQFIFDIEDSTLEGKAILAEKDTDGKLIDAAIIDIPQIIDKQITVEGSFSEGNVLECYLWKDIESMSPYCAKVSTAE